LDSYGNILLLYEVLSTGSKDRLALHSIVVQYYKVLGCSKARFLTILYCIPTMYRYTIISVLYFYCTDSALRTLFLFFFVQSTTFSIGKDL